MSGKIIFVIDLYLYFFRLQLPQVHQLVDSVGPSQDLDACRKNEVVSPQLIFSLISHLLVALYGLPD